MIERISTDLPVPEPPDHAENLAAPTRIEAVMDDLVAEAVLEALHLDDDVPLGHQAHPMLVKKTAKKASSTITRKMPWTTAVVVLSPTSSALPSTCMP